MLMDCVSMLRSTALDDGVLSLFCKVWHASVSNGPHDRCRFTFRGPVE